MIRTVVSRAKAKRRQARRKRREAQLARAAQKRRIRLNQRDASARRPSETDDDEAQQEPENEQLRMGESEESSVGDAENGIGDIIRQERAAGQADQQRSNNGGGLLSVGDWDEKNETQSVIEHKEEVKAGKKGSKMRRVVSISVGRLGNTKVLEWRKGLRRRKNIVRNSVVDIDVSDAGALGRGSADQQHHHRTHGRRDDMNLAPRQSPEEGSSSTTMVDTDHANSSNNHSNVGLVASDHETSGNTTALSNGRSSVNGHAMPLTRTMSTTLTGHTSRTHQSGTRTVNSGHQDDHPLLSSLPQQNSQGGILSTATAPGTNGNNNNHHGSSRNHGSDHFVSFASPHFPPAYYRGSASGPSTTGSAPSGVADGAAQHASMSDERPPEHGQADGSTLVQGGPPPGASGTSSRANEKRPEAYYPAPTTAEQEDAVAVALGQPRLFFSLGHDDPDAQQPPLAIMGYNSSRSSPPPPPSDGQVITAGHLATDDKGVLEQLRLAASMPGSPPAGNQTRSSMLSGALAPPSPTSPIIGGATAPAIEVDEEGFETMHHLFDHDEATASTATGPTTTGAHAPPPMSSILPGPPRAIALSSDITSSVVPSAPVFGTSGESVSNPTDMMAPQAVASAPVLDDEDVANIILPSAPFDENDSEHAQTSGNVPSAPPGSEHQRMVGPSSPLAPPPSMTSQPTSAARASHARRTLGLDLPVDGPTRSSSPPPPSPSPPPSRSDPVTSSSVMAEGGTGSSTPTGQPQQQQAPFVPRFLPKYEP